MYINIRVENRKAKCKKEENNIKKKKTTEWHPPKWHRSNEHTHSSVFEREVFLKNISLCRSLSLSLVLHKTLFRFISSLRLSCLYGSFLFSFLGISRVRIDFMTIFFFVFRIVSLAGESFLSAWALHAAARVTLQELFLLLYRSGKQELP